MRVVRGRKIGFEENVIFYVGREVFFTKNYKWESMKAEFQFVCGLQPATIGHMRGENVPLCTHIYILHGGSM